MDYETLVKASDAFQNQTVKVDEPRSVVLPTPYGPVLITTDTPIAEGDPKAVEYYETTLKPELMKLALEAYYRVETP